MFINIFLQIHLNHYDNYSHWATIVKFLYTEGRLPDVHDTIIAYTSYPMGSSLLVYFATYLADYSDSVLMIGQFALILSCIYAMFSVVRDSSRILIIAMLFNIIVAFNHFNKAIRMNNLLVDFLLPLLALAGIAGIYKMRNNLKAMSIYTLLVVSALTLVKSSAIFFAAIILVYYLYENIRHLFREKGKFKSSLLVLMTSVLAFMPIWLWSIHVKANFPVTKHEVSVTSYQEIFQAKDGTIIHQITDLFIGTIRSLSTVSTQGILLVQVMMIGAYLIIRWGIGRKNPILWQLALINIITIVYYIGIYAMFLFSMPTEEALYLAGFDRYASSMVIMALGLAGMFLARQIDYALYEQRIEYRDFKAYKSIKTKKLYQYTSILLLFSSVLLVMSESGGLLYNEVNYQTSAAGEITSITGNQMILNDDRYLIVTPNKEEVDNYFVGFFGKYWLYSPNVDSREDFNMSLAGFKDLMASYDKIMILEDHYTFNEMTELLNGQTYHPGIYTSKELLSNN
ncbi:lantibiotic ABC transporter permease [Aerococcus viridans]|uniref:lantibiotic ABC transporter permease n=1 Tax=Aerococcus viridans TaxID=1377 RepID=UPI003819CCC1